MERPSEGVLTELELIVEAGKTAQTIIVHSPPSGVQLLVGDGLISLGDAAPELRARWEQALRHFPHCVGWSEMDNRLRSVIEAIYAAPPERAQQ